MCIRDRGKTAAIELCHVSFCYPGQQENVLTDISLAVARGETLAIVGATGSGKSTLLALLPLSLIHIWKRLRMR